VSTTSRFAARLGGAAAVAFAVALVATPPALAAPREAIFDAVAPLSTTVVYGDSWVLPFASTTDLRGYPTITLSVTGIPGGRDGFVAYGSVATDGSFDDWRVLLFPTTPAVIGAGTYRVNVELWAALSEGATQVHGVTRAPQSLTVTPAEVVADLRVAPDRADPQNTVLSMRLGGDWLDNFVGYQYRSDYGQANLATTLAPPGGVWDMTIRDSDGTVVMEEQFALNRGDVPAASMLWSTSPAAETFTVESTFTVANAEARNFTVVQAAPVTFTTGEPSRPVIEVPVVPDLPAETAPGGVNVPTWVLILVGLASLGAAVAAIMLTVRRGARGVAPEQTPEETPEGDEPAESDGTVLWSLAGETPTDESVEGSSDDTAKGEES